MALDPEKFRGVWVKETSEGDIAGWLKAQNVGFVMRQAAWAMGYGKGVSKVKTVMEGGLCCEEQIIELNKDAVFSLGCCVKLDGSRQKITLFEGAPMIEPKTLWVEARITGAGVMESAMFTMDGERHSTALRYVSEDGDLLTTEVTAWDGETEFQMKQTHRKMPEEATPAMEDLLSFCPVPILTDGIPEGSPYKKSVISDSLGEYFSSAEQCLDSLAAAFKAKKPEGAEKEVSLEEVSDSEFIVHITHQDDSKAALVHKMDKDVGCLAVTYKFGEHEIVTFTFHVHGDPIRVEVSNTWPYDEGKLFDSYQWAQRMLKAILPARSK